MTLPGLEELNFKSIAGITKACYKLYEIQISLSNI